MCAFMAEQLSKQESDARRAFQALLNRLVIILEQKSFSDFQEEQLRQLSMDYQEALSKWKYQASKDANAFQKRMAEGLAAEFLETPVTQLKNWLKYKMNKSESLH